MIIGDHNFHPMWIATGIVMADLHIGEDDAAVAILVVADALDVPAEDIVAYVLKTHSLPI